MIKIETKIIKNTAIYLRKSRDDTDIEDVLSKHRDTLTTLANQNKWKYTLYEEIVSGEKIAYRPKMQQLLEDILKNNYDAILVMDIDRLGRGGNRDWGEIFETLAEGNCYIVTPQKTYDVTEDLDEMMLQFQSLFAGVEYKAIKKRMQRGKVAGAKQGYWTNGKPPYPYEYESKTKTVYVNPDKLKIYRMMIDKLLNGVSTHDLAHWMNQNKIPMPSGMIPKVNTGWRNNVIIRIVTSEVHLGKVVYGKTKGNNHRGQSVVKKPKDQWIISEGKHEAIKTQEEHEQILLAIAKRKFLPVKCRAGITPLSGILYCEKCGHRMILLKNRKGINGQDIYWIAYCQYIYPDGHRCPQKGKKVDDDFWEYLYNEIIKLDKQTIESYQSMSQQKIETEKLIKYKQEQLKKIQNALERIFQLYEDGDITKQEFNTRKLLRDIEKEKLINEIKLLEIELKGYLSNTVDLLGSIEIFKEEWKLASNDELKLKAIKLVVKKIWYNRTNDNHIHLRIEYAI